MRRYSLGEISPKKVFLGGTCNGSNWRELLIPKLNCQYFNPIVKDWNEEAKEKEIIERQNADILLYVITPLMKGIYSIAEATADSIEFPEKTIVSVLTIDKDEDGNDLTFDFDVQKSIKAFLELCESKGAMVCMDKNIQLTAECVNKKCA